MHQYYLYDIAGRETHRYYVRTDSAGAATAQYEGQRTAYDALGRVVEQWQAAQVAGSGWVDRGPRTATVYNAYGEVTSVAVGGATQAQNRYDAAGRLVAANGDDGVWKHFGYDKAGNRTVAITNAGYGAGLGSKTFAQALALATDATHGAQVNATYTVYDARGQAERVVEEGRQLGAGSSATLTTGRAYNAFGEVTSETNALGAVTTYAYNRIGRMIRSEGPTVEITQENGATLWIKPSQDYYYDKSGRLVATRDANGSYAAGGTSKTANTGNLTLLTLLAGTGYDGSEALVTQQIAADGGVKQTKYDVHGDARTIVDEVGRTTTQRFDGMGRVTQVNRAGGLVDRYAYDGLGQRIKHWNEDAAGNNIRGSGEVETTDYDAQGRVISARAFGGDVTTTSYTWDGSIAAAGMGITTGGWKTITSTDADRASTSDAIYAAEQKADIFGRVTARTDKGGQVYGYTYDLAGRMVNETSVLGGGALKNSAYSYYNSGKIAQVIAGDTPVADSDWSRKVAAYDYDALGQLKREYLAAETGRYTPEQWVPAGGSGLPYELPDPEDELIHIPASYHVTTVQLQDGRAYYDAAGRIIRYRDVSQHGGADNVDKTWSYDAADNVRSIVTSYRPMQANGGLSGSATSQSYWYRYDSMNRVVTTKGAFVGSAGSGAIVRDAGTDLGYNAAGERAISQTGGAAQEVYGYTAAGLIATVSIGGVTRAATSYDLLGRVSEYSEYDASAQRTHWRHAIVYDARGLVLAEKGQTLQGSDWITSHTANYYSATGAGSTPAAISWSGQVGTATGSLLYYSETKYWKNGGGPPVYLSSADYDYADSYQTQYYDWRDGAVQTSVQLVNRDGSSTSSYSYDRDGALRSVRITGGTRPRSISYNSSLQGQVLGRSEHDANHGQGDPSSWTYMFGGRQMGLVSNDGTGNVDYATAIAERNAAPGTGAFRGGATSASVHADFDANFTALNGESAQGTAGGGGYTVGAGDTLQGIAANLWGDASLWYKLAEANPGVAAGALTAGTVLTVPGGVMGTHHNASTFKPYDPAEAIGNTSPNTPKPPKAKNKCGGLGMILVAVIAVAVATIATAGAASLATGATFANSLGAVLGGGLAGLTGASGVALGTTGAIAAGMAGAVAGSVVSQGFGVATGIQDKFNWKSVGLAALSGGISAGLGSSFGSDWAAAAARGAITSAATQGIGVATGLQSKFDFAGVAAAGIGGGVGHQVGARTASLGRFGSNLAANTAGGIANAATRSAIKGNSFGDNLAAALPDIIGQTIGHMVAGGVAGRGQSADGATADAGKTVNVAKNDPKMKASGTLGSMAAAIVTGSSASAGVVVTSNGGGVPSAGGAQTLRQPAPGARAFTSSSAGEAKIATGSESIVNRLLSPESQSSFRGWLLANVRRTDGAGMRSYVYDLALKEFGEAAASSVAVSGWEDYRLKVIEAIDGNQIFDTTLSIQRVKTVSTFNQIRGKFLNSNVGTAVAHGLNATSFGIVGMTDRDGVLDITARQNRNAAFAGMVGGSIGLPSSTGLKLAPRAAAETAGPGAWRVVNESMSARAAAYQMQVTGRAGENYVVGGVKFDGFNAGTLLDAKGPGYANFVKNGEFQGFFQGQRGLVIQARNQLAAADGIPITWHVAEVAAVDAMRALLSTNRVRGITIVHTPVVP